LSVSPRTGSEVSDKVSRIVHKRLQIPIQNTHSDAT